MSYKKEKDVAIIIVKFDHKIELHKFTNISYHTKEETVKKIKK